VNRSAPPRLAAQGRSAEDTVVARLDEPKPTWMVRASDRERTPIANDDGVQRGSDDSTNGSRSGWRRRAAQRDSFRVPGTLHPDHSGASRRGPVTESTIDARGNIPVTIIVVWVAGKMKRDQRWMGESIAGPRLDERPTLVAGNRRSGNGARWLATPHWGPRFTIALTEPRMVSGQAIRPSRGATRRSHRDLANAAPDTGQGRRYEVDDRAGRRGAGTVIRTRIVIILTLSHHDWCERIPFPVRSRRLSDRPSWRIIFFHELTGGHDAHRHRRPSQLTPIGGLWSKSTGSCALGEQRRVVSTRPNHFGSDRASSRLRRPAPPGGIGHNGHGIR
jgi:hypothetical protein